MGFFDKCVLNVLRDGRCRDFNELLGEVYFSHNTLRLHLRCLLGQGLVVKEKTPSKGTGRLRFTYSVPTKLHRQASRLLSDPL
jgi:predicted transcriptional regulator